VEGFAWVGREAAEAAIEDCRRREAQTRGT